MLYRHADLEAVTGNRATPQILNGWRRAGLWDHFDMPDLEVGVPTRYRLDQLVYVATTLALADAGYSLAEATFEAGQICRRLQEPASDACILISVSTARVRGKIVTTRATTETTEANVPRIMAVESGPCCVVLRIGRLIEQVKVVLRDCGHTI